MESIFNCIHNYIADNIKNASFHIRILIKNALFHMRILLNNTKKKYL